MIKKTKYSNILNKEFKVFALFDSDTESTTTNTSQNKTKRYLLKISKQDRCEKGTLLGFINNASNVPFSHLSCLDIFNKYLLVLFMTRQTFVGKVMSLLLNMLSRLVIT